MNHGMLDHRGMHPAAHSLSSAGVSEVLVAVREARSQLCDTLMAGFVRLANQGLWADAVQLLTREGRIAEADLAKALGVSRSTVNRWVMEETRPPRGSMRLMTGMVRSMIETTF